MGRFQKRVGGGVKSPVMLELTWQSNPERNGIYAYRLRDDKGDVVEQGDMRNIAGVVLDQFCYGVTGRDKQSGNYVYSTMAKSFTKDEFTIFHGKAVKGGESVKPKKIYEGDWEGTKSHAFTRDVPNLTFTKFLIVMLTGAEKSVYLGDGKSEDFKPVEWDEGILTRIAMKGKVGVTFSQSAEEAGLDYRNIDGLRFVVRKTMKSPNRDQNKPAWLHPWGEFRELTDEAQDMKYADLSLTHFNVWEGYLKKYFKLEADERGELPSEPGMPDEPNDPGITEDSKANKPKGVGAKDDPF